ncbi:acetate--CoA ligase family protein [Sandaracinus amylolyticus]|uniref:Archaeal succinyl-CoA ligase [ADP-forming] beta chain n=1 Tax=Sandaracinus amylolyticus TaxID=927083 RepID=A0A0F6YJ97_9BACT|nr:acetate--CoA ligase family protein [Sandaracinus amylolyticus]AKF07076.1 Archaeal succinyl-CoA ligase [ADP-forming] beta chain [Sandaracinus amylolyticus]
MAERRASASPPPPIAVVCDDADLAVELARLGAEIDLAIAPSVSRAPVEEAATILGEGRACGVALSRAPEPIELVTLARACFASGSSCAIVGLGERAEVEDRTAIAADLGLVAVDEVRPMVAALALMRAGATQPWSSSARGLPALDRARVQLRGGGSTGGRLARLDDGRIGWGRAAQGELVALGEPRDVREALRAMRDAAGATPPGRAVMEGVDERAATDVLFGPPRALSDPASKAALQPYGLPLPVEELCSSPSRAAAEAARIGFPVRIALASPDLRIWDHPDLAVDGVDNAARVRDVFRQIMSMASERSPDARLLGVTVTATTTPIALLGVRAMPLEGGWVLAEIGFADPHGLASGDRTRTVLPASAERLERTLARLRGSDLVLAGTPARRRTVLEAIDDAMLRLTAFVDRRRDEIVSVEIRPLAILVGGGVEVREACVTVGEAFVRRLDAPARG